MFFISSIFIEYLNLFLFLFLIIIISLVILVLSYLASTSNADIEKVSAYECGFDPFGDARHTFDIKFYLVAILFIIFDLEIVFLFPWSITVNTFFSYYLIILFLIVLTIGFLYEWKQGALDW